MFKNTKLKKIGPGFDFEVLNKFTGESIGAIIRQTGTKKEWENSGGGLPWDVFYKGNKVAICGAIPASQQILDKLVKGHHQK